MSVNLRPVGFISRTSTAAPAVFSVGISRAISSDSTQSARAQRRALRLEAAGSWGSAGRKLCAAAAGVCALLLLGGSVSGYAQTGSLARSQTRVGSGPSSPQAKERSQAEAASHGLSSLPAAAQGPISAVLGRDDSRYWRSEEHTSELQSLRH